MLSHASLTELIVLANGGNAAPLDAIDNATPFMLFGKERPNHGQWIEKSRQEQTRCGEADAFPVVGGRPLLATLPQQLPDRALVVNCPVSPGVTTAPPLGRNRGLRVFVENRNFKLQCTLG